ncbi:MULTISPECIES: sensor histidine kinase [Pseudomonas]|jgi:signal transduction histidine kinase|uniref:sensor histidine kinase n=1 Tax=Pseudomonas TaxID=286 RepID=UPI00026E4C36|nr:MULTISPECIES: HAMP domain-containing sensor histidine kinase [Pseudomonas]AMS16379.1 two-component sensor histidine kinase [Pseudomonas chlororaphis]AZD17664.1 Two-component system sensor histidine kinase [Pseudomonas chlororaphis]EJL00027.1 sensor histidine kinase ColS [Pseudomonas chlororaphis subsp. aureofaciens 30-84]MCP1483112.1 signal transduction histidine kinase [Pseudomonas chlororaphis]MCP1596530.1 signal transduction histidine kinase [Pseudomonas chlororaphis]
MEFKQSLSQRIIIAFALMSALVAGAFALGIVATVHLVEEKLISAGLGGDLQRLLLMDNVSDWSHRPEPDQLFYFSGGRGDFELPKDLRHLDPGFHEVFREQLSYHAMVEVVDGRRYVLLQDQSDFEERERVLFAVVLVGFVLSLALAVFLGWVLARRVMAPVVRLARQVRHRDQLLGLAPPLAPDYAADEVGELAVAFDATLGRLRQALNRERLFTSDVSHELRTPLMVLASSCELLLENPAIDQRGRAQVERIARACGEMRELVQTFLMLARAQREDGGMSPQATLSQVAEDLVSLWGGPIRQKGLELIFDAGQPLDTRYNATFLHAVMGNLLRNALHYTEHGFIRLSLEPSGFVVEDSGVGIPEEKREAMFEPFVRGNEKRGEGLGLGLSLVQRICEDQGWSVSLSTMEPNGCRFHVELNRRTA